MKGILRANQDCIRSTLLQFICFAGVGAVGTSLHFAVLHILATAAFLHPVLSSTIGFVAGAIVNYQMNYRWTFRSNKRHKEAMCKFMVIASVGMLLNAWMMYFITDCMHVYYMTSQMVSTCVVLLWNFSGNKIWTFR